MTSAPWWVTLLIGLLTVIGAFFAAQRGAKSNQVATEQREQAAAREEWFRRVQWANGLALSGDDRTSAAGFAVLSELADSPLATADDLRLLLALSRDERLDKAGRKYEGHVATITFAEVEPPTSPADDQGEPRSTSRVRVTQAMVEAAKLRVKLSDKLSLATSPVIEKIADADRAPDRIDGTKPNTG
jgi:hypothetical protein